MKDKVILIEPVLAHYRKDVFTRFYKTDEFDFEIIAGKNYQGIKSLESNFGRLFKHKSFKLFKHRFFYLGGALAYILTKKPKIIISTGIDFHLLHTLLIFVLFRIILRKKFYWWSHATYGNQGSIGVFIRKIIYKSSTGIFSYNHEGKRNLLTMGLKESKIQVVNNSINREDYGFLNYNLEDRITNEEFTILYSGRLNKAKKVDLLIRALAILNEKSVNFKCNIVGDGNIKEIRGLVKQLKLQNQVELVGAKYGTEVHRYFLESDIFVYPGGIGLSNVHANSYGLPVITSNNYEIHGPEIELLEPTYNGDIYQDGSFEDLADKIIEWKEKIEVSREVYANNCIQRIKKMEYLPDLMYEKVIDFLKEKN